MPAPSYGPGLIKEDHVDTAYCIDSMGWFASVRDLFGPGVLIASDFSWAITVPSAEAICVSSDDVGHECAYSAGYLTGGSIVSWPVIDDLECTVGPADTEGNSVFEDRPSLR